MNKHKILLVDDEADILNLLQKALELDGFENIHQAKSGLTAIKACKDFSPDTIVLDVMLPDIDGYEVCKQVRQFSHCPILFYLFLCSLCYLVIPHSIKDYKRN